ncbi:transposase domain-containing protein [Acidobacterium sp. S8]|uniref:transposase domain-containing protein n=1 Tax=Acidobacterium sp. S8 TaxID=1641854 RepID=UPI001C20652B
MRLFKLNGLDPELNLRRILETIADHPVNRNHELLPWTSPPLTQISHDLMYSLEI